MSSYTNVYSGEDCPKDKTSLWVHHSVKNDLSSPLVAEMFSKGKCVSVSSGSSPQGGQSIIVNGTWAASNVENEYVFTPDTGEPSWDEAAAVMIAGGRVILHSNVGNETYRVMTELYPSENSKYMCYWAANTDYYWAK